MTRLPSANDRLSLMLRAGEHDLDLPLAALTIQADHGRQIDVDRALERYREFEREAAGHIVEGAVVGDAVAALNRYFFGERKMRGNSEDYFDPRNCFLSEVLERGLGTAGTLAIPYLGALRRRGLSCAPVMLPGQLVVRIGEDLFVDLFDRGRIFNAAEALRKARQARGQHMVAPHELAPLSNRDLTVRILHTLKKAFRLNGHTDHALAVVIRLLQASPGLLPEIRDRGMLHHDLGNWWRAVDDLSRYLSSSTDAEDSDTVQVALAQAFDLALRLN